MNLKKTVKKIVDILSFFIIPLLLWFLIMPRPITPEGYFDHQIEEDKKRYNDISTYTSECNYLAIVFIAYKYQSKGDYAKCAEWIEKTNQCIALQTDKNDTAVFFEVSQACRKK